VFHISIKCPKKCRQSHENFKPLIFFENKNDKVVIILIQFTFKKAEGRATETEALEEAAAGTEPGWETATASGEALEETATEAASGSEAVSAEALAQGLAATVPAWAGLESPLEAK